jgi:hypothetical protein
MTVNQQKRLDQTVLNLGPYTADPDIAGAYMPRCVRRGAEVGQRP